MHINLEENKFNVEKKIKDLPRLYDYLIIGSGPAASVILNNLIKNKKKILVVEKGSFKKKFNEKLNSDNFKIKRESRVFGIGGTSNSWSQIYSLLSKNEMCNNKNINIWPLSHNDLQYWCKKVGPKYKFNIEILFDEKIYKKTFYSRGFVELKNPLRFSKYYYKKNFDLLTNCDVKTLDEIKNKNSIYFKVGNKNYRIYSKKIIICAGAVESCTLILNSLKDKKLKKLKNKKYLGRYFMDHPKCYVGELKYPKEKLIDVFKLKFKNRYNTYKGLSLFQKKKKTLNTYVRFEEKKVFFKLRKKFLIRIFLEMEPKYQNRIYIKNNSANVNLSINKNEIKISNKLLNFIKDFFSKSPKLEKLSIKATIYLMHLIIWVDYVIQKMSIKT